jgi:hypothetical protein
VSSVQPDAEAAVQRALELRTAGDLGGAERESERALELGSARGAMLLSVLLFDRSDFDGAHRAEVRADELGSALGAYAVAVWCREQQDWDGALAASRRADERGSPDGAFALGSLLYKRGDEVGATDAWRRGADRGHEQAALSLASVLWAHDDLDGAEQVLRRADERGSGDAAFELGRLLGKRGNHNEGVAAFARARTRRSGRRAELVDRFREHQDATIREQDGPPATTFLEAVTQALAHVPARLEDCDALEIRRIAKLARRGMDEGRNVADSLRPFQTVNERSRPIEREWYRDALENARDWLLGMERFDAWERSSGTFEASSGFYTSRGIDFPSEAVHVREKQGKQLRKFRKRLEQIGDPTAPGWRPPWRERLAAWRRQLEAAAGQTPAPKPRRETVHVPRKDGDVLYPVTANVFPDRTAILPDHGLQDEVWQFTPGTRVDCELREIDGCPALVAVASADQHAET